MVTFGRHVYHQNCALDVLDESGRFVPDKMPGYRHGRLDLERLSRTLAPEEIFKSGALTAKIVWVSLKAGETFEETCDISKFYDLSKPGVYKISTQPYDSNSASTAKSNVIELTVRKSQ